tara:strand:- start:292 stop:495 length:204 start_codon:yes stop_codon:yes gene_type:complete
MDQEKATELIPISQVAQIVGNQIGWTPELSTIREWARTGKIKSRKIGGRIYVEKDSITIMFEEKESK